MNENIKNQFPILKRKINGKDLLYFDNAATTQKPQAVLDCINEYYAMHNANIHRGSHVLARESTNLWNEAHETVARFLNAKSYKEIFFVRNTTEGLNILVQTYGRQNLKKGDIVVTTEMEHHSNIVPWLILQKEIGFDIKYIPVKDDFSLDMDWYRELIKREGDRIKIVSFVHISNVLGTLNPAKEIIQLAHSVNAFTIVDAAQSVPHIKVDVKDLDCDALVFSGHKIYSVTGSGAVYCKESILNNIQPIMGGGDMISSVSFDKFELNDLPWRFEAGTPNIEGGIALSSALSWFTKTVDEIGGWDKLVEHEQELIGIFLDAFDGLEWFKHFGKKNFKEKYGVIAFGIDGFSFKGCKEQKEGNHEGDSIVDFLSDRGVAVREGYHCAEPLHDKFRFGPTMRASFAIYNTKEEVLKLTQYIKEAVLSSY